MKYLIKYHKSATFIFSLCFIISAVCLLRGMLDLVASPKADFINSMLGFVCIGISLLFFYYFTKIAPYIKIYQTLCLILYILCSWFLAAIYVIRLMTQLPIMSISENILFFSAIFQTTVMTSIFIINLREMKRIDSQEEIKINQFNTLQKMV